MFKKIIGQSSIIIISRIIGMVLSIIGTGIISRALDREFFGMYAFLNSFAFFSGLFSFGLGSELQNRLVSIDCNENKIDIDQRDLFLSTFYLLLLVTVGICLLSILVISFIDVSLFVKSENHLLIELAKWLIPLFLVVQLLIQPFSIASQALYSYGKINLNSYLQIGSNVLFVGTLITASLLKAGFVSYVLINAMYILFNSVIVLFVLMLVKKWKFVFIDFKKIRHLTKGIVKKGLLFWVLGISSLIITQSSVFLVGILNDIGSAGDFSFYNRLYSILVMLHMSAMLPFWPSYSRYYEKKEFGKMKRLLKKSIYLTCIYFAIGIISILVLGPWIILKWSGRVIISDNLSVVAFSLWVCLSGFGTIFSIFLNSIGNVRIQSIFAFVSIVLFVPVAFYLGKLMGPAGIPLSTALVMIPSSIYLPMLVRNTLNGFNKSC